MDSPSLTPADVAQWLERAGWRVSECEEESRDLSERGRRREKLARRTETYKRLVQRLRGAEETLRVRGRARAELAGNGVEETEREVLALRERLVEIASSLVSARDEWQSLRSRWDQLLAGDPRARRLCEKAGKEPFRIPNPAGDASSDEKAAREILRGLGL